MQLLKSIISCISFLFFFLFFSTLFLLNAHTHTLKYSLPLHADISTAKGDQKTSAWEVIRSDSSLSAPAAAPRCQHLPADRASPSSAPALPAGHGDDCLWCAAEQAHAARSIPRRLIQLYSVPWLAAEFMVPSFCQET